MKDNVAIKVLPMRNIEVLVLGGSKAGKTTLIKQLFSLEEGHLKPALSVGMSLYKKEFETPSGEIVKLCIWDPAITCLPKEQREKIRRQENAKKSGFVYEMIEGDMFGLLKPSDKKETSQPNTTKGGEVEKSIESSNITDSLIDVKLAEPEKNEPVLPYIEEFQKDTNRDLAHEYLVSGTYHVAIFVYDLTSLESFREMEYWFDRFRQTCKKSQRHIDFAIVGTKLD